MKTITCIQLAAWMVVSMLRTSAAGSGAAEAYGDAMLAQYFRAQTAALEERCLADVGAPANWETYQRKNRAKLFEMLGLDPLPERTDLKVEVTGRIEREDFAVENLHFQSMPGLYVTANLYLPKGAQGPAPVILYLCGHGPVVKDGVSYGNKVHYQHHGIWFARRGYVCLVMDTVQLGEIEGIHHGTYREGMWWWNARGYSSAGAEAWNCIRALDYLETRPEVDSKRMGATGRSGGGAYSWWVAALDERIRVAAPVAGITDLRNHVVDGVVEGHCDCMFIVNTYRWDYPKVAALVAPRPLLIVNTDSDTIFPLDGVQRTFAKVRSVYESLGAKDKLGLVIGPGPHKDTQDLQVPVFRWFNKHLLGEDPLIESAAVPEFEPEQLKVFKELPRGERTSTIHESFVSVATPPALPANAGQWERQCAHWMTQLREKSFAGWPLESGSLELRKVYAVERQNVQLEAWDFTSQPSVVLRLYRVRAATKDSDQAPRALLHVLSSGRPLADYSLKNPEAARSRGFDGLKWRPAHALNSAEAYPDFLSWLAVMRVAFAEELERELSLAEGNSSVDHDGFEELKRVLAGTGQPYFFVAPRGGGLTAWNSEIKKQIQIRRRFMLLGQTLEGMRVWDLCRSAQALHAVAPSADLAVTIRATGDLAADALYASLFERGIQGLELWNLPPSHARGPDYLNVLRFLDIPQAVAMAMGQVNFNLHQSFEFAWEYPRAIARNLGWPENGWHLHDSAAVKD